MPEIRYTEKEFGELFGKAIQQVYVNRRRRKIVLDEDGLINLSNPVNKDTYDRWMHAKEIAPVEVEEPKKEVRKKSTPPAKVQTKKRSQGLSLHEQKTEHEIERIKTQTAKMKLEMAKIRGENIPTALSRNIITILGNTLINAYKNDGEKLLLELFHEAKVSTEIKTKYKKELIKVINESHKRAIEKAKRDIRAIAKEISTIAANKEEDES